MTGVFLAEDGSKVESSLVVNTRTVRSVGEWDILVGCAPRTKCLGLIDAEKELDPVPEAIPRTDSWTGWFSMRKKFVIRQYGEWN